MNEQKDQYIVYAQFGEATVPILCEGISDCPFKEGMVTLLSVSDLKDNVYPNVEIHDLIIPKDMITYYLKGVEKDNNEKSKNDVSKAYDSQGNI